MDASRGRIDVVRSWRTVATVTGTLALVGGAAAPLIAPGAAAAAPLQNCANKSFVIEIQGAPGTAPSKFKVKIEAIRTQGVSCQAADKFLEALYKHSQGGIPGKYKCTTGKFKVPPGKVPQVCTRPGAKIQYAGQGG